MSETTGLRTRGYAARMPPERRREQLLDAVLRIVVTQGVHKVSMDAVAREVGVTRPVVYGLFKDSNDLLRGSLAREEQAALAQLADVFSRAMASPRAERVATLLRGFLQATLEAPDRWRAILALVDSTTPAVRKRLDVGRRGLVDACQALLRSQRLGDDFDFELAAHALQAYMNDGARLALAEPAGFSVDRIVEFGTTLFEASRPAATTETT